MSTINKGTQMITLEAKETKMNYNEKHLLKQFANKSKEDFDIFTADNNANNFSDEFHSKFTDLYNSIEHEKNIKKDLDNDYSIQQKRLYTDDIIA